MTSLKSPVGHASEHGSLPIWIVTEDGALPASLSDAQRRWLDANGYKPGERSQILVPGPDGALAGVLFSLPGTERMAREGIMPRELAFGALGSSLPKGAYHFASTSFDVHLAAVAWGLGAYQFRKFKSGADRDNPTLVLPDGVDRTQVASEIESIWLGRDLINTPAGDLGPAELEAAVREVASEFGAEVSSVVGDDLLAAGCRLIHAVGRASPREPRLIDMRWGRADAPRVTLVGKGVCFDTGGLDIKPASGMLLMKKDMGGAATSLALARMIMAQRLDVRLRVLISAVENSVSGNAFRPGDVIRSRAGKTVEIGNTDAEGRLVLADALDIAREEHPAELMTFATLTGAARVALGPDLPPFYTDDETVAAGVLAAARKTGDHVWRMPFWDGYEPTLASGIADMNNVSEGAFAGSVTAALFLRRFAANIPSYAHFDIFGWRPVNKPWIPKGGEPQAARAILHYLRARYGATH